ncbi:MAG: hypothetical protein COY19_01545 [Candidatus Marinimicrobia bacterium CG_4_10_14_0_2_um_filter_48_9]|nr:MAG: hypothetical protein COY19_01545 [Candidatus Marinimicrobia bacterium CG_4_10_14_0_2_um_filter_48_9]PJA54523.1 MAG: hypothetical protein CO167_03365 [Candidatus Marinimicrobia bacterium CG_4_9_14_3_um_filter_48_9]
MIAIGCGLSIPVRAAFETGVTDAKILAAGNVRAIMNRFGNPALLQPDGNTRIGMTGSIYLSELGIWGSTLTAESAFRNRPYSLTGTFYGDEVYGEYAVSVASGHQLYSTVDLGIALELRNLSIQNYGNYTGGGLTIGAVFRMTQALALGISWQNVVQKPLVSKVPEPELFCVGLKYSNEVLDFMAGMEKDAQLPINLQIGALSTWSDWWRIAVGYESAANSYAIGTTILWSHWEMSYAWQWRAQLPPRQMFSLYYSF